MNSYQNPKVLGAFLVGFAIVGGTYLYANFGKPRTTTVDQAAAAIEAPPPRVFIPVSDSDTDGIEDWRDQFITSPAVVIEPETASYKPPTTVTGQLGIALIEDLLKSKVGGPVARTEDQIIQSAVNKLELSSAKDIIYDQRDIVVVPITSPESVRAYGNAIASILMTYNVPDLENELLLLRDHLTSPATTDNSDLVKIATMYKEYRDNALTTPVPKDLVKVHLDLINVFNALYISIDAMAKADADPAITLVRLKRYEDDAVGLKLALDQTYNALLPYAGAFEMNDPAIVFVSLYKESP